MNKKIIFLLAYLIVSNVNAAENFDTKLDKQTKTQLLTSKDYQEYLERCLVQNRNSKYLVNTDYLFPLLFYKKFTSEFYLLSDKPAVSDSDYKYIEGKDCSSR